MTTNSNQTFEARMDLFSKALLAATPLLYVSGFLIYNSFLLKFGVIEVNLLRAEYLLAGFSFTLIMSVVCLFTFLNYIYLTDVRSRLPNNWIVSSLVMTAACFVISAFFIWSIDKLSGSELLIGHNDSPWWTAPYLILYLSLLIICTVSFTLAFFTNAALLSNKTYQSIVASLLIFSSLLIYSNIVFQHVSPSIGGGKRMYGKVTLDKELEGNLARKFDNVTVAILAKTDKSIYFLFPGGSKAVEVSRDKVIAIDYSESRLSNEPKQIEIIDLAID